MRDQHSSSHLTRLIEKFDKRSAVIGIIGLGYVGLPLSLRYAEAGFRVLGIDIDPSKVARLNAGASYIEHISVTAIGAALAAGFEATGDFARAAEADALLICVPTPLGAYREPDLSFVLATADALLPYLRAGQVVSLESTTYPGTTDEELRPRIASRGLKIGEEIFLVFSPEREDPGNPDYQTRTIPKVCGGDTPACLRAGIALYSPAIDQVVPVSSTRAAELTKLLENIHRAVNIGLVNEMKIIADKMDIDIHEVIRAAATKPFGFTPYYPGPGLGGHCIPIDPFYLTWKARQFGLHTRFIELAGEINSDMPHWVIGKLADALNERSRSIRGSRVLVLGIAYKKNVEDMRESPSVELMEILRDKGALVDYSDPHVPLFPPMREHHFNLASVPLTAASIASYDVLLLATSHSAFDYALIQRHAALIVDTRGVYLDRLANVVKA
ncbi:nucleotide sugar dehydrogenase [Massilia sp. P8910]|uniref:nucleotide sugar dehydrogenase n=1 Tax=Massilia antarctica TaxID=2765360 RepID=UPI0006BB5A37|nr:MULTISPECIES: nucleotide sugar dehydrogenase [Massilia]MCE3606500.1 nucleotide sugar dehydrogenase [Massilia antarctica]MCY0910716.1 nucleotide sugar dehydrogenase [Massilia sp. H27-R4]CUI08908.1 UDP-glucose dehydrogenase [Janthinobacterium sp. CG23_2]CUU32694.1 UDP-glucose dehydrogenase [Janthinobacterium sp. CG23_2]